MDALLRLLRRDRPRIPWSDIASGAAPAQSLDLGDATGLRRQIATRFNEDELRSLLFDLQIDYENLPGQNLDAKARELVLFMARRSQTDALLNALRNARPGVDWLGEPRAAAQNTAVSPTSETNTAPPTTADDALSAQSPAYDCQVVNDVTIPPGWRVAAGTAFEKGWRIKNTGTQPLLPHFQVVFVDGHPMGEVLSYPLSEREDWQLAPGRITDLMLPLRAPSEPEDYSAHWRLQNDAGDFFGDTLVVHIAVVPGPQNAADANASDADPATAVSPLPNLADPDADLAAQIQQRPLTKGSPMQQQTTSPFADVDLADFLAETDDDKAADTSAYPLPSAAAAPRRTWLIPANDALTAEIAAKPFPENPAAQPGAACDRLLLLRPAPDPAVTHLARIQVSREPPATPGGTSFSLESGTPLNNPLPWDQLQRHPALANWDQLKAPLTNLQPVPDAVWPPLRGLLLALNPDLAADLAACEETTPAELLTAALAAANTLQDRRARHDFLSPLLPHLATDPDTAPLLDPLLQDADWRVRQAARRALGRTDTPADLFADAETALQAGLPEDALQLLKDHAA
ncbi:MAG: hypothetical protein KC425_09065, partial [Anaerolineales bacterium]|nr:hypothetical protein [Anaerolineales bacterium]